MERIKVLIQVAAGSCDRHLYNEKTLEYRGKHRMSQPFPYSYGFIIGTSAADGDGVDCYLITKETLEPGSMIECEPVGLLEQDEDGEIDHKVLAAMPGEEIELGQALVEEIRDFIYSVIAAFPEVHIRIGRLLPREAALHHIEKFRDEQ